MAQTTMSSSSAKSLDGVLTAGLKNDAKIKRIVSAIQSLEAKISEIPPEYNQADYKNLKTQLDKNTEELSKKLKELEGSLSVIDDRIKTADDWLKKVPVLKEELAGVHDNELTIRAISAEQLQQTTAFKIIKTSVPFILLFGIGILIGGVVIGGQQINSVMDTAAQANSKISDIKDNFESKLNERFNESTSILLSRLTDKEEEAATIVGNMEKAENEAHGVMDKINDQRKLIASAIDEQVKNRLALYEKAFTKVNKNFTASENALRAINQHKSNADTLVADIREIKTKSSDELTQQTNAIEAAVQRQTVAYFDGKFGIENIRNFEAIKSDIRALDGNLSDIEQRTRFLYNNYLTLIAVVVAAIGIVLSGVALWKTKTN